MLAEDTSGHEWALVGGKKIRIVDYKEQSIYGTVKIAPPPVSFKPKPRKR